MVPIHLVHEYNKLQVKETLTILRDSKTFDTRHTITCASMTTDILLLRVARYVLFKITQKLSQTNQSYLNSLKILFLRCYSWPAWC